MSNARFSILQARAVKDRRISDAQFRTLAALGMYADENGWCFPMLATLGKDLSKSKQAVGRDTIALKKLGYLEVQARYNENGGRRSSKYRLKYDLPVNMDDSTPSTPEVDTPSTPEVDTPSTPEVDVNDLSNDPINDNDMKDIIAKANKSMDERLAMSNFPGAKAEARRNSILSYLGERLHVNTETKAWREFAKYVDGQQQKGEKIETFIAWLLGQDKFQIQYWPPRRMMEMWPQAFVKTESTISPYKPLPEDNNVYVPNPNRRTS